MRRRHLRIGRYFAGEALIEAARSLKSRGYSRNKKISSHLMVQFHPLALTRNIMVTVSLGLLVTLCILIGVAFGFVGLLYLLAE